MARKSLVIAAGIAVTLALSAWDSGTSAQAQPYGSGWGPRGGYGMMAGYGPGYGRNANCPFYRDGWKRGGRGYGSGWMHGGRGYGWMHRGGPGYGRTW